MATLPEDDTFPAGIYRIETTDPVVGGPPNEGTGAGMTNIPPMQLAKRTRWLKNRVDALLEQVVAATTAVAGIVRLNTATNSTSVTDAATPSAVKAAMDNANTRALASRSITAGGLATGGGDLTADRTITVPVANQAEAEAGDGTTQAMTPLRVFQAIGARLASGALQAGSAILTSISALAGTGLIARTGAGTVAARTLTAGRGITVTNGDGVAGNPVIALAALATETTDWNLAAETGLYMAIDVPNAPAAGYAIGRVEVHNANWVTQTLHMFTADGPADTQTWRRDRNAGVWTAWFRLRLSEAEQATLWAARGVTLAAAGLATGGGDLTANRTITVPAATQVEAEAGAGTTQAMTPLRVFQAIAARVTAGAVQAGSAILTAISGLAANGMIVRTAAGTVAARSIAAGTAMTVTNGDGVAGNPTVALTIASQAEAEAGTIDTKGMSPLRVAQAILARNPGSLADNGWTRLPNGLILQWGTVLFGNIPTGGANATVTFPLAFPTNCFAVVAGLSGEAYNMIPVAVTKGLTQTVLYTGETTAYAQPATAAVTWFAIGN